MGYCVIASYEFETDGSVDVILRSIRSSTTQVVAVFADPDRNVPEMLQRLSSANIIFISNRYWQTDRMGLRTNPSVVTNSLSFRLTDPTVGDFLTYLNGLSLSTSKNPWLPEYYQVCFVEFSYCTQGQIGWVFPVLPGVSFLRDFADFMKK